MPIGQAASADLEGTAAIQQAIYTIITTQSGVTFPTPAGKIGMAPEKKEITAYPFAIVLQPTLYGGLNAAGQLVQGRIPRMSGWSQPVHDWLSYILYPYRDPTNPLTASVPEQAKNQIEQAFQVRFSLNQTCFKSEILDSVVIPHFEITKPAHAQPYTAVRILVRSFQRLAIDYTGGY